VPRILLAEPNVETAAYLATHLAVEGHAVERLAGGEALLARLAEGPAAAAPGAAPEPAALVTFPLALPDLHGLQVLRGAARPPRALRRRCRARRGGHDHVRRRGAPRARAALRRRRRAHRALRITEFVARVEAVLRRTLPAAARASVAARPAAPAPAPLRFGDVEVDVPARLVRRAGARSRSRPRSSTCSSRCSTAVGRWPRAPRSSPSCGATTAR
jgi:DNA-binding response OmpR family regulator